MTDARLKAFGAFPKQKVISGWLRTMFALLVFAAGAGGASAKCTIAPGLATVVFTLNMGTIIIPPDAAIGPIGEPRTFPRVSTPVKVGKCSNGGSAIYNMRPAEVAGVTKVYETGVKGVGIQLTFNPGDSSAIVLSDKVRFSGNVDVYMLPSSSYTVQLFKTGPVTGSGPFNSGEIATATFDTDTRPFTSVFIPGNGITVVTPSCTVDAGSKNIVVQLGKVRTNSFSGVGSTAGSRPFDIKLNCSAGVSANNSVFLRMDATPDPSGQQGVLQVAQGAGAATGVGIQVLDANSTGVRFGEDALVGPSKDGSYVVPFTARYFQTAPTMTAGPANGMATFSLNYK